MTRLKSAFGVRFWMFGLILAIVAWSASTDPTMAQTRAPLLMEGKQTIYQRVLTRPGAKLVAKPGAADGTPQPALTRFYVYERQTDGGKEWLEVGTSSRGKTHGWIDAAATLPWKQQMALVFTNPANRDRTLMFDSRETLLKIMNAEAPEVAVAPLRKAAEEGKPQDHVLSIEPKEYVDINKQFYLLPILHAEPVVTHRGSARALEIASVTAREDDPNPAGAGATSPPANPPTAVLRTFSAAVMFVIDSTISMGPYIERTRKAVRRIYDKIEQANLADQVKFGLVAYRSNIEKSPGLEYVSKVYVNPEDVEDGKDFLAKVTGLSPATVSSARFDEDAYSGLMTAIKAVNWSDFGGRYMVLITDAGALKGKDELSGTQLDAEQIAIEAKQLGIAVYALHLKTPQGKGDHAGAESQYKAVTQNAVLNKPLYYAVDAGSVDAFGASVDSLGDAIVEQVSAASMGEMAAGSARSADSPKPPEDPKPDDISKQIREDARLLGHAMQLAYLGREQGTQAPTLFRAWLSDRDFANPDMPTTEVRLLLTKNQLSDLRDVVKAILDAGEQSQDPDAVSTADFFDLLRSSAAHLARDPNQLTNPDATKLGDLGLLGEYLDDLPYKSDVMNLTSDTWEQWSIGQQEDLLDKLRSKLRHYILYHDDTDRWVSLSETGEPGEDVYPVPIDALP
ncbi:MAG: VWA domain-containing protein [Rhodospirillales bacterium]|nr:VWA domain-containing protein [Rhodospirillales bacterium]